MFYPLAVSENGLEDVGWDTVTNNYGRDKDLWMTSVAGSFLKNESGDPEDGDVQSQRRLSLIPGRAPKQKKGHTVCLGTSALPLVTFCAALCLPDLLLCLLLPLELGKIAQIGLWRLFAHMQNGALFDSSFPFNFLVLRYSPKLILFIHICCP